MAKALIVDNDPATLAAMRALFELDGHAVAGASGLGEALACLAAAPPDVIFLDLCLAGGTGLDFLRAVRVRAGWADVPVVVLSGLEALDPLFRQAQRAEYAPVMCLKKPTEPADLLAIMSAMQDRKEGGPV